LHCSQEFELNRKKKEEEEMPIACYCQPVSQSISQSPQNREKMLHQYAKHIYEHLNTKRRTKKPCLSWLTLMFSPCP
jgi:hypothetical protein